MSATFEEMLDNLGLAYFNLGKSARGRGDIPQELKNKAADIRADLMKYDADLRLDRDNLSARCLEQIDKHVSYKRTSEELTAKLQEKEAELSHYKHMLLSSDAVALDIHKARLKAEAELEAARLFIRGYVSSTACTCHFVAQGFTDEPCRHCEAKALAKEPR